MDDQVGPSSNTGRIIFDCVVIGFGLLVFFGVFSFTPTNFWLPWLLALAGVFIASVPAPFAKSLGLITSLIGIYLILRSADIISAPLLGYGLGSFLIIVGIFNLTRDARGRSMPPNKTSTEE